MTGIMPMIRLHPNGVNFLILEQNTVVGSNRRYPLESKTPFASLTDY
jgi:hypothetical protein